MPDPEPAVFEAHWRDSEGDHDIVTTQRVAAGETVEHAFMRHVAAVAEALGS